MTDLTSQALTQPNELPARLLDVETAALAWEAPKLGETAAAADAVFRLHYAPLAGWCRRMINDDEAAHDIAAEAFTRLLGRWSKVEDPRAYLYTTALNLIRDRWRRSERERAAMRKTSTVDLTTPPPAPELRMLVEALPRRLQQVIVLHYFADLPVDTIAKQLGIASGTVKRDLFDARARLQTVLEASQ